jgi:hypothetical protein
LKAAFLCLRLNREFISNIYRESLEKV